MTDCCIIGGGIIGLSIARELAGRGLSVRVLARDEPRSTASWAAAGIFPPTVSAPGSPSSDALTAWSDRLHWQWAGELRDETGIDNGLRRCGGLHLAAAGSPLERLRDRAARWTARGIRCEPLDAAAVVACEPVFAGAVDRGVVAGGVLLPDESQIRPPRHLEAVRRSCAARGVGITTGVVRELSRRSGRVEEVVVTGPGGAETVRAGTYVLAAGAWSEGLAAGLGLHVATRPIRGQILLVRPAVRLPARVVNRGLDYLVPRDDGRLLVGSTLEDTGFDDATTPAAVDGLLRVARDLLGAGADAPVERAWAGLRPGSADGLPTIGRVPGIANAIVATGHFRAGWHQSPGTAVIVADLVMGRRPPLDPAAFAPDRDLVAGHRESVSALLARAAAG